MSDTIPVPGDNVKLTKFPPNRGIMDWDRVLYIGQIGQVIKTYFNGRQPPLYEIWFTSRNGREGYEVWLATEHLTYTKDKRSGE